MPNSDRDDRDGGHGEQFVGFALVVCGVLIGLAVHSDAAGVAGHAIDTALGWLLGIGRFAVMPLLVAGGSAMIARWEPAHPRRTWGGSALIALAVLGLAQLIAGPSEFGNTTAFPGAGGAIGAGIGIPLERFLAVPGAAVLLVAALVVGLMIATSSTVRDLARHGANSARVVARPIGSYAKKTATELSTLSQVSDVDEADIERPGGAYSPALFDGAQHDAEVYRDTPLPPPRAETANPTPRPGGVSEAPKARNRPGAVVGEWTLPSTRLLRKAGKQKIDHAAVEARGATLQESLASHGVDTNLVGMTVGPTVTRYELELGPGVKVARVTSLQKDIAYAMAATDVRILAPIPGRSAIGIEVPNHQRQLVMLGDLLRSEEAANAQHPLEVAVGKDIAGKSVFLDVSSAPHMLIAGATGAGKSSGINCIITSLLMRTTPDQVRLILIDPKQVEMGQYSHLPHLLTEPVTDPKKAANALGWAVKEMERRYNLLFELKFRDISGYNAAVADGAVAPPAGGSGDDTTWEPMPYIVVVVDELNDLMMVAARDVEESITRIAQKARAVGIHLILATQRPSVNVITGDIKGNVPARMAFAVASLTDSRVILDKSGAEKLIGKGDMLLLPGNSTVPHRIQGSFVTEDEVRQVVEHWRNQAPEPVYSQNVDADADAGPAATDPGQQLSLDGSSIAFATADTAPRAQPSGLDVTADANAFSANEQDEDAVMRARAIELVVRSQLGSTSMLQRKLKVGFARAGRIMDELEEAGIVGPSEGSKARQVLMTVEEFERQSGHPG